MGWFFFHIFLFLFLVLLFFVLSARARKPLLLFFRRKNENAISHALRVFFFRNFLRKSKGTIIWPCAYSFIFRYNFFSITFLCKVESHQQNNTFNFFLKVLKAWLYGLNKLCECINYTRSNLVCFFFFCNFFVYPPRMIIGAA